MKKDPRWDSVFGTCLSMLTVAWRNRLPLHMLTRDLWRSSRPKGVTKRHIEDLTWSSIKGVVAAAIGGQVDESIDDLVLSGRIDLRDVASRAADVLVVSLPGQKPPQSKPSKPSATALARERDARERERRQKEELVARVIEQEDKIASMTKAARRKPVAPITVYVPSGKRSGEVILLLSDWHPGDVVEPSTVNGINRFDRETAQKRVVNLLRGFRWTMEMWRTGYHIERLVVGILGDMVTGWIHEDQLHSTSMTPPEEVVFCSDLLDSAIQNVFELDMNTRVVCVTGNHGRTTKRIHHANRGTTSYEWILYHDLARRHKGAAQFYIPNSEFAYLDIAPLTVHFCHGDFFRYSNGVGGITIPMNKAIARQDAAIKADLTCFGHWHQSISLPHIASNGTLKGYDAFAQHCGFSPEPPSQTAVLVDERRGFPWHKRIWVE